MLLQYCQPFDLKRRILEWFKCKVLYVGRFNQIRRLSSKDLAKRIMISKIIMLS